MALCLIQLLFLAGSAALAASPQRPDIIIADFEGRSFAEWTTEGIAFQRLPARERERSRGALGEGYVFSGKDGATAQGELLSPEFKIERKYVNFLVSGNRDLPRNLGVELLIDGQAVRASSATEYFGPDFCWRTWDVSDLVGRTARVRVNDRSTAGAVALDHFVQSDIAKAVPSDASALLHETLRPQFHFTPKVGWMNDANGLFYYGGRWHLFYQHRRPGAPATEWGHAVSEDLLHWQHLPVALPADGADANFSGSGLVDWQNASGLQNGPHPPILLFYTLHPDLKVQPDRKCVQHLAFSTDGGQTWTKYAGNPVLRTSDQFDRDPKVFFHTPSKTAIMLLSLSQNNTDRPNAVYGLYRSADFKSWELTQKIGPGAWYWECPDMFEMRVDGDPRRTKWLLLKGSGDYIVGSFDGKRFTPETEPIRVSWHNSYYGAQSFSDAPGGRRVQVGWMNSGPKTETPNAYPGMPFNQQLSFPRELTLRTTPEGPRLFRQPIAEIARLYTKTLDLGPRTLAPGDNALAEIPPGLLDIECELDLQQAKKVSLKCRGAELSYDVRSRKLRLLRADPTLAENDGRLVLRVLIDCTSIEAFVNQGDADATGVYFPGPADPTLSLTAEGGAVQIRRLSVRELKSIWPAEPGR